MKNINYFSLWVLVIVLLVSTCLQAQDTPVDSVITPVEFIGIDTERKESTILFTWSTASELDNNYFILQMTSDPIYGEWETIGQIWGSGTSKFINKYSYNYTNPDKAYYRLYQVDYDGTVEMLALIMVDAVGKENAIYYDLLGRITDSYSHGLKLKIINGWRVYKVFKL